MSQDITTYFEPNIELEKFKSFLVAHQVFTECEQALISKIARPGSFNILSVVGPTGVGKTQLLNEVAGTLLGIKENPSKDLSKQPYLPVVYVTATTGHSYESRFRSLLLQIVRQVNEAACVYGKVVVPDPAGKMRVRPSSQTIASLSIARLEELVRTGLKERQVRALLIDEAQHLAQGSNAVDWRIVGDGLKVLGSVSGTMMVLFGTSELLGLPYISGQLGRRSKAIHLRRYLWNNQTDRLEFKKIVSAFGKGWPTLLPTEFMLANLPLLYAGSLGCTGILSTWLYDAMVVTEQAGLSTVTVDILKQTALSAPKLLKIEQEAKECEDAFLAEQVGLDEMVAKLDETFTPKPVVKQPAFKLPSTKGVSLKRTPKFDAYASV